MALPQLDRAAYVGDTSSFTRSLRAHDRLRLLADALDDGTVESGRPVTDLVATADGVRITLGDGTTREADGAIGADGVASVVARSAPKATVWKVRIPLLRLR